MVFAGCGGSSQVMTTPENSPTFGPNGGPVGTLPGGGVFEVIDEPAGSEGRLVAYFYASNAMDAPLSPAPSNVSIDLAMPGGESTTVTLTPGGGDSRFASSPGDYVFDPLIGTLNATVDGETVSVPFSGGQS